MQLVLLLLTAALAVTMSRNNGYKNLSTDLVLIEKSREEDEDDIRDQGYEFLKFLKVRLAWNTSRMEFIEKRELKQCCWFVFKMLEEDSPIYLVGLIPDYAQSKRKETKVRMHKEYPKARVFSVKIST